MAFELHRHEGFPGKAASQVNARQPVRLVNAERGVGPATDNTVEVFGIAGATAAPGEAVTVYDAKHVAKAVAAASVGAGANVGVASPNGALGPIAGASGAARHRVGQTVQEAREGEVVSVYVNPQQLSGLV